MASQNLSPTVEQRSLELDLAQAMDLETLDELADEELGIPRPAADIHLSEILSEEDPPDLEDNGLQVKLEMLISADSQSLSSYDSSLSRQQQQQQQHRKKRQQRTGDGVATSGSVLHHGTLRSVSNQLLSAMQRTDAGLPTCITVGSYIAVGTAHGSVFLFDTKQALQWCLDSADLTPAVGGVSALEFSYDMRKLLVGYTRGHMTLWDTRSGKRLMRISDAHPPGTAVLHARYTLTPSVAVFSDSSGSVYRLTFGRQLTRRTADSACLFSGSRGEICALSPMSLPPKLLDHPLVGAGLLAMASFTKVFLVRLLPDLAVLTVELLGGRAGTLPQVCWQVGCCGGTEKDPCLVYGRDDVVRFARVSIDGSGSGVSYQPLKQITLSRLGIGPLLCLHFLHSSTAIVCDQRERLSLLDVETEAVLETESLNPVQLVYNTAAFKALATGSNVSQALAYAADTACYHSVRSFEGQLVMIGAQTLHIYRLRSWEERLLVLRQRRQWPELFKLACDLYNGRAAAVVGLTRKPEPRRQAVRPRVRALLEEFLSDALSEQPTPDCGGPAESPTMAAELALTACHRTDQLEWLFSELMQRSFLRSQAGRFAFLESLRPFLVNCGVRAAPPPLIADLLNHLVQTDAPPDSLEELILHLDVACLDADAVLRLSWQRGLYDAVVYVHTVAMGDPVTPLKQLLEELKRRQADSVAFNQFDASFQQLGGKSLVHLSACLAGQPYFGQQHQTEVGSSSSSSSNVQLNVFSLLVNKCARTGRFDNLEALCRFSIGDLLNFLALAFQEAFFAGEAGLARKQELLDDLVATVADGRGFSPAQVGQLFSFLVKLLVQPHSAGLQFPTRVFDQVLEYLCTPADHGGSAHQQQPDTSEQQSAVIALLNSGRLSANVNSDRLLALATEAGFHRVRSHLYLERREFAPVVECMLADDQRASAVFDYVSEILSSRQQHQLSDRKRRAVKETCWRLLDKLVATDAQKTVLLVIQQLEEKVSDAVKHLEDKPGQLRYQLLGAYFALLRQEDMEAAAAAATSTVEAVAPTVMPREDEEFLTEAHLTLMAEFAPSRLVDTLRTPGLKFNPRALIKRLHSQNQTEAEAACYELSGQPDRALDALLPRLDAAWDGDPAAAMDWLGRCCDTCARSASSSAASSAAASASNSVVSDSAEQLWFRVLDRVLQRAAAGAATSGSGSGRDAVAREACRCLVARMSAAGSGVASLPSVLRRLLSDPAYTADRIGELQDLLVHLLDSCRYEGTLLAACAGLVGRDANSRLLEACRAARRAASADVFAGCAAGCGFRLDEPGGGAAASVSVASAASGLVLFRRCGHACHAGCCHHHQSPAGSSCPACSGSSSQHPRLPHQQQQQQSQPHQQRRDARPEQSESAMVAAAATARYFRLLDQLRTPDRSEFFDSLRQQHQQQQQLQARGYGGHSAAASAAVQLRLSPATPAWL